MRLKPRVVPSWRYPQLRRKPKTASCWCNQRAEEIVADITILLDMVMSRCYPPSVKVTPHPIERQMRLRLYHEAQRMKEIKARMDALAGAYNEFRDLLKELPERKARMTILLGLIGEDIHSPNSTWATSNATELAGSSLSALRSQLSVWEAMKEYLQHVPEARIGEMEEFFSHIGYEEGNRQAMESALKRRPKEFNVRRKKREKYISLKK